MATEVPACRRAADGIGSKKPPGRQTGCRQERYTDSRKNGKIVHRISSESFSAHTPEAGWTGSDLHRIHREGETDEQVTSTANRLYNIGAEHPSSTLNSQVSHSHAEVSDGTGLVGRASNAKVIWGETHKVFPALN